MSLDRRWFHLLISALALLAGAWGFSVQVREGVLPDGVDPEAFAYPVRVADRVAHSPAELRFVIQDLGPGAEISLSPADGPSRRVVLTHNSSRAYYALTLFGALYFWAVATLVFALRSDRPGAPNFYWITLLYGLALMTGGVYHLDDPSRPQVVLPLLHMACLAYLPPALMRLALGFPRRLPVLDRRRWLMPVLWAASSLVLAWQGIMLLRYFASPGAGRYAALAPPHWAADALMVVLVATGLIVLTRSGARAERVREKQQVRWLLWGFAVGAAPYVFLRTLPQLLGAEPPLPAAFDRVLELAVPTAFVFAVVRYRFLDIDIIIRRSLIYGALASVLVLLVMLPVLELGRRHLDGERMWLLPAAAGCGLAAGLLFGPMRRAIGTAVDRVFFKLDRDLDAASADLARRLESAPTLEALAGHLDETVGRTLAPRRLGVILRDGETLVSAGDVTADDAAEVLAATADAMPVPAATVSAPGSTGVPEIEAADFPEALSGRSFVLARPLAGGDRVAGLILLGRRATGRRYIEQDIDWLGDCARIAAAAVGRLEMRRRAEDEALRRRQADELNRLKTNFLSRVAHDLRTPLASIDWSVQNLVDGLAGDLNEKQRDYLTSVRESVDHLGGLVADLLEISRLEKSVVELPLTELALRPVLEGVARTAAPLAERRDLELVLDVSPPDLSAVAHADKLRESLLNLVDNAVKYSPEGGVIELTARAAADGRAEIVVRDHGPGLGDLDRPFDRFVQGAASPDESRQGFGLGLYIVREYLHLMGGEVSGADHPDGGALFRCLLPGRAPGGAS